MQLGRRRPFVLVDVGARDGIDARWAALASDIAVVAIDADGASATAADRDAYADFVVVEAVLADANGKREFFLTRDPGCSSMLPPDRERLQRFPEPSRFDIARATQVATRTLDDVLQEHGLGDVDFIKIDTQGSEALILRGAASALRSVIGIEVEVEFLPIYEGQEVFADVDALLRGAGFELFDLNRFYWRRAVGEGVTRGRGQLAFADALYLRPPERFVAERGWARAPIDTLESVIMVARAYGYLDYVLEAIADQQRRQTISAADAAATRRRVLSGARRDGGMARLWQRVPGRGRLAKLLERCGERVRPDSWAWTDHRLGNSWK